MQEKQKFIDNWAQQFKNPYFPIFQMLARLTEEVGELAREISDAFGIKKKKSDEKSNSISNELGDILFTVICMANSLEIDLNKSLQHSMDKAIDRDNDRYQK